MVSVPHYITTLPHEYTAVLLTATAGTLALHVCHSLASKKSLSHEQLPTQPGISVCNNEPWKHCTCTCLCRVCPVAQRLAKQSQRLVLDSFAAVSD